jgi:hypothetical protein
VSTSQFQRNRKKNRKLDTTRTSDRQIKETHIEIGIKKDRKYRKMERWKDGKMERWKDGKMESWKELLKHF